MEPKSGWTCNNTVGSNSLFSALDDPVICSEAFWGLLKETTNIEPSNKINPQPRPRHLKPISYHRKLLAAAGSVSADKFEEIQGKEDNSDEEELKSIIDAFQVNEFERKKLKPEERILAKDGSGELDWSQDIHILAKIPEELRNRANLRYIFRDLALTGMKIEEIDEEMEWFPNLQKLDLSENNISVLQHLPYTLSDLAAYNNEGLSTISQQLYLPNLLQLGLAYNEFTSLEMIPEVCPYLLNLDLAFNHIANLRDVTRALGRLPRLVNLNLSGNPVTLMRIYRPNIVFYFPNLHSLDGLNVDKQERFLTSEEEDQLDPLGDDTLKYEETDDAAKGIARRRDTKKALTGRQKILAARYVQRWYRSRMVGKVAKVLISMLSNARTSLKTTFLIEVKSLRFPEAMLKAEGSKGKKFSRVKSKGGGKNDFKALKSMDSSNITEMEGDEKKGDQVEREEGFPRVYVMIESPTNPDVMMESHHKLLNPEIDFRYKKKLEVMIGLELRDALHFGCIHVQVYHEDCQVPAGKENASVKSATSAATEEEEYEIQTTLLAEFDVSLSKMLQAEIARQYRGIPRLEKDIKVNINHPMWGEGKDEDEANEDYKVGYLSLTMALNAKKFHKSEEILFRQSSLN